MSRKYNKAQYYKKKQIKYKIIAGVCALIVCVAAGFGIYEVLHQTQSVSTTAKKEQKHNGYNQTKAKYTNKNVNKSSDESAKNAESTNAAVDQQKTLKQFLKIAMQPVGSTMYIWGGGWNKEDTGAGKSARTIGVSPLWKKFSDQQDSSYNYENYMYQIKKGLDCSGYVGWVVYNYMETENMQPGYVYKSKEVAKTLAEKGFGTYIPSTDMTKFMTGDIMSSTCNDCGHVYIVIGQCEDGSVVLVHASPPGTRISGTPDKNGNKSSQAVAIATKYMKQYFPEWYAKYPTCVVDKSYLTHYSAMRWNLKDENVMTDPDGISSKTPDQILDAILN